jgi:hypothetical protein
LRAAKRPTTVSRTNLLPRKPLKNLKLTLNYYEKGSVIFGGLSDARHSDVNAITNIGGMVGIIAVKTPR